MHRIEHATILGAGIMGAQIAAHLANAGLAVRLLDLRRETADGGLARARRLKPDPFFLPETAARIVTGSFDDLSLVSTSDWIIEAVVERLDVKRQLVTRLEPHVRADAIVSSNTSGISISDIANGCSPQFRARWLGTHFFNPPRYLHLVELIPTAETDPAILSELTAFIDLRLGKGVVTARDTPGFIANRIGLHGVVKLLHAMAADYTVEEIDLLTGPLLGRPKSATCRTLDIAGLDILAAVTRDLIGRLTGDDREAFNLPPFVHEMIARGWLGEKAGQGFYKRVTAGGETRILTLDVPALADGRPDPYRERREPAFPSVESAGAIPDPDERLRALFRARDPAGSLLREAVLPSLHYAIRVAPDVADSVDEVDRAMRWGFGWRLGPSEMLAVLDGPDVAPRRVPPSGPERLILQTAKSQGRVLRRNPAAELVDLGEGVACVEFHAKLNVIGEDTIALLHEAVSAPPAGVIAVVIGNEAEHFSAGANLLRLLLEAQDERWEEIDAMVRAFQAANMAIKTAAIPVIAAPAGLALGGGCEICLHADRVQAAAETYMGLVELGVGLIPAAGGTKEMLLRASRMGQDDALRKTFETIALAKVSTSALDARRLGYLRDADGITMNRERVLFDASAAARVRARSGYQPAAARTDVPVGGADRFAQLALGVHLAHRAGRISDHDALVARKLASVLTGGDLPHAAIVSEQYLLDLEREAFLSLCGEAKTLERIAYTLKTGKTLRN